MFKIKLVILEPPLSLFARSVLQGDEGGNKGQAHSRKDEGVPDLGLVVALHRECLANCSLKRKHHEVRGDGKR